MALSIAERECKGSPADAPIDAVLVAHDPTTRGEARRRLVCAACGATLSDDARRTERAGLHRHLCANPAGFVYEIRLFEGTWTMVPVGEPSAFHSWFPGTTWQIAVCRGCTRLIGWLYQAADAPFAGLTEGAFVEVEDEGSRGSS